jgi:hypothetical protein
MGSAGTRADSAMRNPCNWGRYSPPGSDASRCPTGLVSVPAHGHGCGFGAAAVTGESRCSGTRDDAWQTPVTSFSSCFYCAVHTVCAPTYSEGLRQRFFGLSCSDSVSVRRHNDLMTPNVQDETRARYYRKCDGSLPTKFAQCVSSWRQGIGFAPL